MPKPIKNILAVRNDRFGEFLLNIPALRALKETFQGSNLILCVDPYVKELAGCIPFVDEVITWTKREHPLAERLRFVRQLSRRKIDLAVMLNPSRELNILTFLCAIPQRLGYDRKWDFLLTCKIKDEKKSGAKHEVEYNLDLVGALGAKTEDRSLSIKIEKEAADKLLGDSGLLSCDNLIALHPWTSDLVKQWPLENFLELAKKLSAVNGIKVIIVGGKENLESGKILFDKSGENIVNFAGKTTLKELAALLKRCKLLISADSGPMHLAACVGTPVLALFRTDMPGKTAKRWGPWGSGHIVIEKTGLNLITVEEVFNAAVKSLV